MLHMLREFKACVVLPNIMSSISRGTQHVGAARLERVPHTDREASSLASQWESVSLLSDYGASLTNSMFHLKATWLEKKGVLLDSGRLKGFEIVTFRSHNTTLKVIRFFCRSQHTTSCLVLGLLELFCGSHYMTLWRQGGHMLQDFWPPRNP